MDVVTNSLWRLAQMLERYLRCPQASASEQHVYLLVIQRMVDDARRALWRSQHPLGNSAIEFGGTSQGTAVADTSQGGQPSLIEKVLCLMDLHAQMTGVGASQVESHDPGAEVD